MLSISSNIFVILENLFNLLGGNFRMPAAGGAWESQPRSEARHTVERPSTNWDAYQFVQIWDFYANQKWVFFFALLGDSPPTVQIRTLYFNIEGSQVSIVRRYGIPRESYTKPHIRMWSSCKRRGRHVTRSFCRPLCYSVLCLFSFPPDQRGIIVIWLSYVYLSYIT